MAGERGCTVFVGNIDFEVPVEKIIEELSAVGRVVGFRMVTDRTTGKPKGYGFCTYESPIIADMAVNKLKITLNGRMVKINYADKNAPTATAPPAEAEKVDVEMLAEALEKMDPGDTKEVLKHIKKLAVNMPEDLKKMLKKSPELLTALLHMLFTLGLASKQTLEGLLSKSFSIDAHKSQILTRILQYHDYEVDMLPEDLRDKAVRIRERLLRK